LSRYAVVLAAGRGERLWPLTSTRPKPLLPLPGGETLLSRLLVRRFKTKRAKALQAKFKQKLSGLKYTGSVDDPKLEKVVRHGIHQDADKVYEKTDEGLSERSSETEHH